MFNFEDFNTGNEINDDNSDDTEFVNRVMTLTRIIKQTDFNNENEREFFMMHVINMAFDDANPNNERAIDVVIALSVHLMSVLKGIHYYKEEYLDHFDNNIMLPMISNLNGSSEDNGE
jgi:hypothetical protein